MVLRGRSKGFTIVELLITLAIAAALLALGVAGVRSLQGYARDDEREADVAAIARGLEQRYANGNPYATAVPPDYVEKGSYPGINEWFHMYGSTKANYTPATYTGGYATRVLPGTSTATFTSPSGVGWAPTCSFACQPAGDSATINSALSTDKYAYEPVASNGAICYNGNCPSFNIYWKSEVDGTIHKLRSKHR